MSHSTPRLSLCLGLLTAALVGAGCGASDPGDPSAPAPGAHDAAAPALGQPLASLRLADGAQVDFYEPEAGRVLVIASGALQIDRRVEPSALYQRLSGQPAPAALVQAETRAALARAPARAALSPAPAAAAARAAGAARAAAAARAQCDLRHVGGGARCRWRHRGTEGRGARTARGRRRAARAQVPARSRPRRARGRTRPALRRLPAHRRLALRDGPLLEGLRPGGKTDLVKAANATTQVAGGRALCVILSDLLDPAGALAGAAVPWSRWSRAAAALTCDRRANSSTSARLSPHLAAMSSEAMPWDTRPSG